jgi:hypothetical protein
MVFYSCFVTASETGDRQDEIEILRPAHVATIRMYTQAYHLPAQLHQRSD